jgi:hypothetical protein
MHQRKWRVRVPTIKLPAISVNNRVLWANKSLPFKFRVGKPTKLGLFLTPRKRSEWRLEAFPWHGRTGILGRVLFKDKYGNFYRDIDLKGIGHVGTVAQAGRGKVCVSSISPRDMEETWGLEDKAGADFTRANTRKFLKAGIRTALPIAQIEIKQIVDAAGDKISIEEARDRGLINKKTDRPVITVRAFGTRNRIGDFYHSTEKEAAKMIADAKMLVKAELGTKKLSDMEYYKWFAQTLGGQLAKMHNKGLTHGYLTSHNITLDARIVDLDSIKKRGSQAIKEDYIMALSTLGELTLTSINQRIIQPERERDIISAFEKAYKKNISQKTKNSLAKAKMYVNAS